MDGFYTKHWPRIGNIATISFNVKLDASSSCLRKQHLDHLVGEYVDYYNKHRSSMVRDHLPPVREEPDEVEKLTMDEIEVKSYVGGLVKSFERKAA